MCREIKTILYHGTISEIDKVDVNQGRGRKDFGKGFYMSVQKKQAVGMMHKKFQETIRRSRNKSSGMYHENLYEIRLNKNELGHLKIKVFEKADLEWLEFILLCREHGGMPHDYDMVIGPTADDDTMLCLKSYWDGLYGRVGSDDAKRILLNNLEVENLGVQYYVGKQEVAERIIEAVTKIDWS